MSDYPQVLFRNRRQEGTVFLADYEASGGYQGLRKALTMTPQEVRELVITSYSIHYTKLYDE